MIDFVSIHVFPEYIPLDSIDRLNKGISAGEDVDSLISGIETIYLKNDHLINVINILNQKIKDVFNKDIEVHITEWNASSKFGNLIHDTVFVATYIIENVLNTINKVDSLGYWTFTDLMEENKLGVSHFHGGFGLINKDGLKKPGYNAFYLLSKLGNEIIKKSDNFIVTKKSNSIQILAYNHAEFDELFMRGETSHINNKDRYSIYKDKKDLSLNFKIDNLEGHYKITKYKLDRNHGSVYDEWNKLGAQEHMNVEEVNYLKNKERPLMTVDYLNVKEGFSEKVIIPIHGVVMLIIEKSLK